MYALIEKSAKESCPRIIRIISILSNETRVFWGGTFSPFPLWATSFCSEFLSSVTTTVKPLAAIPGWSGRNHQDFDSNVFLLCEGANFRWIRDSSCLVLSETCDKGGLKFFISEKNKP